MINYPFSKRTSRFLGRIKTFDASNHPQYFIETVSDALTDTNPRNWDIKKRAIFDFTLNQVINEIETVVEYMNSDIAGESAMAFINKHTGEKELVKLGTITQLDNNLKNRASKIEDIIYDLSEKNRTNLLVNIIKEGTRKKINLDKGPI